MAHAEIFLTFGGGKELPHDQAVLGVGSNPLNVDPYRLTGRDRQQSNRVATREIELDRRSGAAGLDARLSLRPVLKLNVRWVNLHIRAQYVA